tara:strand:- start:2846 stop:3067 length:222 start_codon:yes stop_codon:yes gene_type:complete
MELAPHQNAVLKEVLKANHFLKIKISDPVALQIAELLINCNEGTNSKQDQVQELKEYILLYHNHKINEPESKS